MTLPWTDDLAVLLYPWRVKDGIILPSAQRCRHEHRGGRERDEGEGGDDRESEPAGWD